MDVLQITVNGQPVEVAEPTATLLDTLRYQLGLISVKDGCSPQGQCGCCTVLVDGQARVSCVTPVRRVRGRSVVTIEGLDADRRSSWGERFCAAGASQCGFCTPGIIMRLEGLRSGGDDSGAGPDSNTLDRSDVDQAMLAHLCRCTGWQTIIEAACGAAPSGHDQGVSVAVAPGGDRDLALAGRRAELEGATVQRVDPAVPVGLGRFAADTAPPGCLVAVPGASGDWVVGDTLHHARQRAGKVQGRRTTVGATWPIEVPDGSWAASLQTTWVDVAYLETDASWCEPGGEPAPLEANGGAFGAKVSSGKSPGGVADAVSPLDVSRTARRLADEHGRPVLALANREDVTRFGAKRPPVAGGISADGTGRLLVARTPGVVDAISAALAANPELSSAATLVVEEVDVVGPPTSVSVRAAGWAEAIVLLSAVGSAAASTTEPVSGSVVGESVTVRTPAGASASASVEVTAGGEVHLRVSVSCGPVLDAVVLRSYCIGAAHMAWSWLTSESLAVDDDGVVQDLTVRSFGVLRAVDTPVVSVEMTEGSGEPVNGSDAVFVAVAAAGWRACGHRPRWPVGVDALTSTGTSTGTPAGG